jgi:hypothetical protein
MGVHEKLDLPSLAWHSDQYHNRRVAIVFYGVVNLPLIQFTQEGQQLLNAFTFLSTSIIALPRETYAKIPFTTFPATSVNLKSRPR